MIGTIAWSIIGFAIIGGSLFLGFSPEFGGKPSKEDIKRYQKSGYYNDGVFQNIRATNGHELERHGLYYERVFFI